MCVKCVLGVCVKCVLGVCVKCVLGVCVRYVYVRHSSNIRYPSLFFMYLSMVSLHLCRYPGLFSVVIFSRKSTVLISGGFHFKREVHCPGS